MTYPAGTDLATSFQDGQPQPLSNARLISSHIGEFCCGIGGMETTRGSVNTIPQQNGDAALLFSGRPSTSSRRRRRARCSGEPRVWVRPGAQMSYWVYPEAGTGR